MKFKRLSAAILAGVMCFGVFSTTAFAYVDENAVKEEPVVEEKVSEEPMAVSYTHLTLPTIA